ncbi:MAG: hypothetical protein AABY27_00610, partial [Pseudomonadota bacterium]
MITLLASLVGFISSLIPEIMKYFIDRNDKKHELDILEQQIKSRKNSNFSQLEEILALNSINESNALYKTYKTGICWVDALNGTVRPILAYSFFGIYGFIKYLQYKVISASISINDIVNILWSIDDQAIFAGIITPDGTGITQII